MQTIDVLIIGAGPAGLLTASQLANGHRITVIDRGLLGRTSKFWATTQRRLERHGLQEYVLCRPSRMSLATFLGSHAEVQGDFAVVDDERMLSELIARCRERGVQLIENCELLNFRWRPDGVEVHTSRGIFWTRLVADATGGSSRIARSFRLHRIYGFYAIYGAMLQGIRLRTDEIVLGYVGRLDDPVPIFEVIPTGPDSAYGVVFIFSQALVSPTSLAEAFRDYCQENPYFEMTSSSRIGSEKSGAIPIGRARRRRLPGVVSLGEAALIQPPLLGTAFNAVLDHSETVCRCISQALQQAAPVVDLPRRLYPGTKWPQDRIQLMIARQLIKGSVELLDNAVMLMSKLPQDILFNFFSHELTLPQIVRVGSQLPLRLMLNHTPKSA